MTDPIKVKILPCGTKAKEVNPLGENKPDNYKYYSDKLCLANAASKSSSEIFLWQKSESNLRTFEIDFEKSQPHPAKLIDGQYPVYAYLPDSIHSAIIVSEGKIRIV